MRQDYIKLDRLASSEIEAEGEATVVLGTEALAIYPFVCGLRSAGVR